MSKLDDLVENAHFQLNQIDWEKNVKDFVDRTYECLHNDMTDIFNVQEKCINVEDKLMNIFEYVKFDIQRRLSILQNIHRSLSLKFDSDISHTSSYHQFHNEVNIIQEKPSENNILSSIYAIENDLLKLNTLQKYYSNGMNGYCSAIRSIIYSTLKIKKQLLTVRHARRRLANIKQQLRNSKSFHSSTKQQLLIKNATMLDNVLAAMQHIIAEIAKQVDSTYSVNRLIALFNELYRQFHHTHQNFFSQERWMPAGRK
ncbi:unnamed protein product [Litomosoides sigmodontis]|uniref:Uncharacterized protein n=1 Tax=Litomosoides sigmodontis TaxID=42156 RepID=A0A3P6U1N7_LITSI|nr:unnamed protein product [Litomosoides sigmodontis]